MSDSMERDKPDLLTVKEKEEEEEMKRELQDMKMYETWYTYKDMKQVLGFINESKDMANMAIDEKNAQKELLQSSNNCTSDVMPKTNLVQELEIQEHSDTSRLIHPHRSNRTLPILDRISTHSRSSPEPATTIADSRNSVYKGKNLDNDDMFDRLHDNPSTRDNCSYNMNKYVSLKLKNSLQDSHSIHNTETNMETHSERDQKLDRWQINPLDSCVSENDVPLQQPERPFVQDRMPFKLCKDAQTSETLEKLLLTLNIHLKQTSELWHSWHRTADSKFQWGSPIQVGLVKGSSDKKALINIKTEENQVECTNKYNNERPHKRKSTLTFSSNTRHSSSDEDEKSVKRKKIQSYEGSSRILRSHKEACVDTDEKDQYSDNTKNISRNFDNMETKNLEVEHQRKECLSFELHSLHSRNITPPNPRKYINKKKKHNINMPSKSLVAYNSNDEQSAINLVPKEKSDMLTDEEILVELEKDNTNVNIKTTPENIEIKPLPIRGLSRRIKNECMVLEKIQIEKQRKIEIEKEETQKKETEEKKKREEFHRKQIEERQRKEKQKEEKDKSKEEKSKKWNSVVDMKTRKKIGEEGREKLRGLREQNENKMFEITEENKLIQDSSTLVAMKMEIIKGNLTNNVNCPICNQSFPSDKIETHAAGCEQYPTDNEDENNVNLFESKITSINVNNEGVLECGVCLMYRTTNRAHYEDHVNNCLQKQRQEESFPEYTSSEIDNILNSPVRCYRPISEQTDSDIDYRRQFPSNSRTQIHSSKKRKH